MNNPFSNNSNRLVSAANVRLSMRSLTQILSAANLVKDIRFLYFKCKQPERKTEQLHHLRFMSTS